MTYCGVIATCGRHTPAEILLLLTSYQYEKKISKKKPHPSIKKGGVLKVE
jgi:hypothetical protein